jgi:AMP nucleosidase
MSFYKTTESHLSQFDTLRSKLRCVKTFSSAKEAVAYIKELYDESSDKITRAFFNALKGEEENLGDLTHATYPYVALDIQNNGSSLDARIAYGVAREPGIYGSTLTRPDLFSTYYEEQLDLLMKRHKVEAIVGLSDWPIPLPFVVDHLSGDELSRDEKALTLQSGFVLPSLTNIDDSVANGTYTPPPGHPKPLSLFDAERVDFSLNRLHHYTGTGPEHFQGFVLLTNYQRYIDEFIDYSKHQIQKTQEYIELIGPGNVVISSKESLNLQTPYEAPKNLPQMPAYHLKRKDGNGITFVNIGVGPSNAKTITDHLAVLRPHCWLMLGHCAGLRSTQLLGDYVLAHGYVREDHVLDQDLPQWISIPPIAEVQVAMQLAVEAISDLHGPELKLRLRTGTLVTTDNRNWELRSKEMYERFLQSRAIAVDMESATVAGNGFRFRVPYGTLLCVSDKPIHGELKLRGMANAFYRQRVSQHLKVGLETIEILRNQGVDQLHSRKLRGFDEPPFR